MAITHNPMSKVSELFLWIKPLLRKRVCEGLASHRPKIAEVDGTDIHARSPTRFRIAYTRQITPTEALESSRESTLLVRMIRMIS